MFWEERVLEAERDPVTVRFCEKVEEADEISPPDGAIEKRVDVPAPRDCWTWKALPVCPVKSMRERRLETVEVAPIVTMLLSATVVVPMPSWSVKVVKRTRVPSSVKPERF